MKAPAERATAEAERRDAPRARPADGAARTVRRATALLSARSLPQLQRRVGNSAVAALAGAGGDRASTAAGGTANETAVALAAAPAAAEVDLRVQRKDAGAGDSCPPPAPPPTTPDPHADPKFAAVKGNVDQAGAAMKKHPSAKGEADKAGAAAKAPSDDKDKQAKTSQAADMAAAKPKGFDKAAFVAAVKQAIAKQAPQNLDDADKFASSGKADSVKGEVMSKVTAGKDASTGDVKANTEKPPDTSAAKDKPVTPLAPQPPVAPPPVDGAKAMPGKAPAEQTNLGAGPCDVDSKMRDAQVTEQHLTKSNEPAMQGAVTAKKEAEAHAEQAPQDIRDKEAKTLADAQTGAQAAGGQSTGAMAAVKKTLLGAVGGDKSAAKDKNESERARISGNINKIFDATKKEVDERLKGLDTKVNETFESGEAEARRAFTAKHKADMDKYKDDRYSGPVGWARWTEDLFADLPAEANQIYVRAKTLYEDMMTGVINKVADIIATELDATKARIAKGRQEIADYLASEPKDLQKVAAEAAKDVSGKFDQLESDVDSKQEGLVDDLASKYVEARNAVDEEIKAEQEKNKGLVSRAKDAVVGSIETILKLKDMFLTVLAKAAAAFPLILNDPGTFIKNFMNAVKLGLQQFVSNIWKHLKAGLLGWLFGALGDAGIEIPATFDLKGILQMVGSIFGLTVTNLKNRIVKAAPWIGTAIDFVMDKIEIIKILVTQGISGVWNWIKDKLSNLKEMIMTPIIDFVKEKIIMAGVSWLLGMLNPAGALVKIIQALIGVVSWILERGQSLMEFVSTIIDSVTDIAKGGTGGVPDKIEQSLAKAVPLVISFLASLLGLGGISEKIQKVLKTVQTPVNKALDWVIKKGLTLARPLIRGAMKLAKKAKDKVASVKAKVKGAYNKVKGKVVGAYGKAKGWVKKQVGGVLGYVKKKAAGAVGWVKKTLGIDDSPEGKQKRLDKAMKAAVAAANKYAGKHVPSKVLNGLLWTIKLRNGLKSLKPVTSGDHWAIEGSINPTSTQETQAETPNADDPVNVPRRHADGIATVTRHGEQGTRNRNGPRIHWLESEHILPYRIGAMLWEELGLPAIARKANRHIDEGQTTIMLYKGAADRKTYASQAGEFRSHADKRLIDRLKAIMSNRARPGQQPNQPGRPARTELRGLPADLSMPPGEMVEQTRIAKTLETVRGHAAMRTNKAVREDYAAKSEDIDLTHGARRGIPPGAMRPSPEEVETASTQQLNDVKQMATAALADALQDQE